MRSMLLIKYVKADYSIMLYRHYKDSNCLKWMSGTDHYYNTIPIIPINPRKCSRIEGEIWKSADWLVSKSVTHGEITGTRHGVTDSERDDATTGTSRITMTNNKNKILGDWNKKKDIVTFKVILCWITIQIQLV